MFHKKKYTPRSHIGVRRTRTTMSCDGLLTPQAFHGHATKKSPLQIFNECMSKSKTPHCLHVSRHGEQHYQCFATAGGMTFLASHLTLGKKEAKQLAAKNALQDPRLLQLVGHHVLQHVGVAKI